MVKTNVVNSAGETQTIGDLFGFKVVIYYKDSLNVPTVVEKDIDETLAAKVDGSKRRVVVQTSGRLAGLGVYFDNVKEFVFKYLF